MAKFIFLIAVLCATASLSDESQMFSLDYYTFGLDCRGNYGSHSVLIDAQNDGAVWLEIGQDDKVTYAIKLDNRAVSDTAYIYAASFGDKGEIHAAVIFDKDTLAASNTVETGGAMANRTYQCSMMPLSQAQFYFDRLIEYENSISNDKLNEQKTLDTI